MDSNLRLLCLLVVVWTITVCARAYPPTLRYVNLLYRHGDRTPLFTFPTDQYGLNAWPQGPGQLTQVGVEQHFSLGQYYRKRYDGFINESYNMYELTVHSSDVDRCLMSAESHLCGFYSSSPRNSSMPCEPVPIHTRPELEDHYLAMFEKCPQWDKAFNAELDSREVKRSQEDNQEFFDFIKEKSGMSNVDSSNIFLVRDTLYIQSVHNFTLPDWANETVMEKLTEINGKTFSYLYKTPKERRLKGGALLKLMIGNMDLKMNGSLDERAKMAMYSGHDATILALLETMNLYDDVAPEYAWSVLAELHEHSPKSFYVNVFYKNDSSDPKLLTVPGAAVERFGFSIFAYVDDPVEVRAMCPINGIHIRLYPAKAAISPPYQANGCQTNCPIDKFKELTKDYIPGDWEEECKLMEAATTAKADVKANAYKVGLGGGVVLLAVSRLILIIG